MTYWTGNIVPQEMDLFGKTMGEHVADMVRAKYPRNTAKTLARVWGIALPTAKSVVDNHASERVLATAIKREGWTFLEELGHRMTGQSFLDWKAQEINKIIEEANLASANVERLRSSIAPVAGASDCPNSADDRPVVRQRRHG